jgi:hypothetical protein
VLPKRYGWESYSLSARLASPGSKPPIDHEILVTGSAGHGATLSQTSTAVCVKQAGGKIGGWWSGCRGAANAW